MTKIVRLSTGDAVHLREKFTHRMHKELFAALNKGVVWKQNLQSGDYEKEMPAVNIEMQYEAVLGLLVEKIVQGGTEIPYSQEWLDDLLQKDYRAIEEAAAEIRLGPVLKDESGEPAVDENGKKKYERQVEFDRIVERARAFALSKIGGTVSAPPEWTEYKIHRRFNCLPEGGLDAMEEWMLRLWIVFANIEAEAGTMGGVPPDDV